MNKYKKEMENKRNIQKFLNKEILQNEEIKNRKKINPMIINNNNNLIKFINVSNTPNGKTENIINPNNMNFNINTPITSYRKNKIELKLNTNNKQNNVIFNGKNIDKENINKENNKNNLFNNIFDKDFNISSINSKNNEEKDDLNNNIYNNHKYLYINNSKEKNRNKINNDDGNDFIIYKNKKYKIEKIPNNNIIGINNYINNKEENKFENDCNKNNNNKIFLNNFDDRIEKIRETLNSIKVIDILSEQAGLQSYKKDEPNDNELYDKAKKLNKDFYDNLDIKLYEIENILNNLEKK